MEWKFQNGILSYRGTMKKRREKRRFQANSLDQMISLNDGVNEDERYCTERGINYFHSVFCPLNEAAAKELAEYVKKEDEEPIPKMKMNFEILRDRNRKTNNQDSWLHEHAKFSNDNDCEEACCDNDIIVPSNKIKIDVETEIAVPTHGEMVLLIAEEQENDDICLNIKDQPNTVLDKIVVPIKIDKIDEEANLPDLAHQGTSVFANTILPVDQLLELLETDEEANLSSSHPAIRELGYQKRVLVKKDRTGSEAPPRIDQSRKCKMMTKNSKSKLKLRNDEIEVAEMVERTSYQKRRGNETDILAAGKENRLHPNQNYKFRNPAKPRIRIKPMISKQCLARTTRESLSTIPQEGQHTPTSVR